MERKDVEGLWKQIDILRARAEKAERERDYYKRESNEQLAAAGLAQAERDEAIRAMGEANRALGTQDARLATLEEGIRETHEKLEELETWFSGEDADSVPVEVKWAQDRLAALLAGKGEVRHVDG